MPTRAWKLTEQSEESRASGPATAQTRSRTHRVSEHGQMFGAPEEGLDMGTAVCGAEKEKAFGNSRQPDLELWHSHHIRWNAFNSKKQYER